MARKSTGNSTKAAGEGNVQEPMFNKVLGQALQSATAHWRANPSLVKAEHTDVLAGSDNSGKHPDILILDPRSPPFVIECSYDPKDADKDAMARLGAETKKGRRMIKTCISLHVPQKFKTEEATKEGLLQGDKFRFAIYQKTDGDPHRWPEAGFVEGDVWSLTALISAAALPKEDIERVAEDVADMVNDAAGLLETLPDSTKQKIDDIINRGSVLKSLKITMVLWLNALLTQQRLHDQGVEGIPALNFASENLPEHAATVEVWRRIFEMNWRAIFGPAIKILEMAGNSEPRGVSEVLGKLMEAVGKIEMAGLGLHINVGAELFPKLSDDRKRAAAYYTQASTAELLAGLTIRKKDITNAEWADGALFTKKCLADLACGTGTLLRAGYRRVQAIHEASVKGGGGAISRLCTRARWKEV